MQRKTAVLFLAGILLAGAAGCAGGGGAGGDDYAVYTSYRDIPGVSEAEAAAIEALKARRGAFTYGMNLTAETFYDEDGEIAGFSARFCRWLTDLFGIAFEPAVYDWDALIAGLDSGEIDFSGELTATEERRSVYYMTDPIAERMVKAMRISGSQGLQEIARSRLLRYAFFEGTTTFAQVTAFEANPFDIFFVGDYESAYRMLKSGEIDAFFDEGIAEAAFDSYGDVTAEDFFPLLYSPVSLAARNPELEPVIAVVQKALRSGASRHLNRMYIQGQWDYQRHKLFASLTGEEQQFIRERMEAERPIPVAAEYDNYPVSFYNSREQAWQGVALDVLAEIGAFTGLTFTPANEGPVEWPELMTMLESGEASVISELIHSAEREGRFLWPDTAYQTDYYALLSRSEYRNITINEVLYSRVGLMRDTAFTELFHTWFPNHPDTREYGNTNDAFDALERGDVDLVMATRNLLLSLTNFQEQPGFKVNLIFKHPYESAFGFNIRESVLCSIVSKALRLIDTELISDRWTRRVFDYRGKMAQAQIPWLAGASGLFLCLIALLLVMFLRRRQEGKKLELTVRERTEDLVRQSRFLHTVNEAASLLLASNPDEFEDALRQGMEMMARNVKVDHIYIWKNRVQKGVLHYTKVFGWVDEADPLQGAARELAGRLQEFSYLDSIPEWVQKFQERGYVNGPLSSLSPLERERLAPYGIRSILVIPVFLQDALWGFVSFDDCRQERYFSAEEEGILRSGSLLLVNAMMRNETTLTLREELARQELLASVTLNMTNPESFDANVNYALKSVGEFMHLDTLCFFRDHSDEQALECIFEWVRSDAFQRSLHTRTSYIDEDGAVKPGYRMILENPFAAVDNVAEAEGAAFTSARAMGIRSLFNLPVYVEGKFWGFIALNSMTALHEWSEGEINFLKTLGAILGRFIENDVIRQNLSRSIVEAQAASRAKSDFLANMSHEIRTPMNAIIGMTSIAKTSSELERKDYCLDKIEDASVHLLGVINDILDMSKIEANKFDLSFEEFDFEKMLRNVVNIVNFRVDEKKQHFTVHIDGNIPRYVVGDDQRLAQVITNLVGNAVKFTPEQGSIVLNAALAGEEDGVCTIQVEVTDAGIGISPEQQARLFTSFEQAESSTSRKFGGTGLGLAISKRIVELMGGTIWVESELGKGSTFAFTIQAKRGRGARQGRRSLLGPGVDWKNIRVLAVDDDPDIQLYFKEITRGFEIHCDIAGGGEEAVELINRNGSYDVCFVDWKMPGMNGIELARRIKADSADRSVVIMISATEWTVIEDEAKEAGVDRFLPKPLFPSAIADCINECLGVGTASPAEKERNGAGDSFEGRRILLAEDVEINQEILLALLEPTRLAIDCAANGAEALKMFSEAPESYDMIFMDIQMPEMDGYEAARRIRALGTARAERIPIVAMTANVFREDIEKCLAAGMNDHVGKPLDLEEVLEKLRLYLLGERV